MSMAALWPEHAGVRPHLTKVLLWLALAPFGRGACPGAALNARPLLSGSKDRFGRTAAD